MDEHDLDRLALLIVGRRHEPGKIEAVEEHEHGERGEPRQDAVDEGKKARGIGEARERGHGGWSSGFGLRCAIGAVSAWRCAAPRPRRSGASTMLIRLSAQSMSSGGQGEAGPTRRGRYGGDAEDQHRHVERQHQKREQHAAPAQAQRQARADGGDEAHRGGAQEHGEHEQRHGAGGQVEQEAEDGREQRERHAGGEPMAQALDRGDRGEAARVRAQGYRARRPHSRCGRCGRRRAGSRAGARSTRCRARCGRAD